MTKIIDVKISNIICSEYLLIMPCTKEEFEENFNDFSKDDNFIVIKSEKNLIVIKNSTEINTEENIKLPIKEESINQEDSIIVEDIPTIVPKEKEYTIIEAPKSQEEYKVDIKTYTPTIAEEVVEPAVESKFIQKKIGYIERR